MNKRLLLLFVTILMGSVTAVNAKFIYVPLYIIDTQPDVKVVKRSPAAPLFITQDDHRLILPEIEDSITFKVLKGDQLVYQTVCQNNQTTVLLPSNLIGDYEVRLCADTYYYYGYITLSDQDKPALPTEYGNWKNIAPIGNSTSQEDIFNAFMGINVVGYNRVDENDGQRYIGMLCNELKIALPQVTDQNGFIVDGVNVWNLLSLLVNCIQDLKVQLDSRTEALINLLSRNSESAAVREVRAAIGNTLLTVAPSSVSESAHVRYLLADDATNAYILVTDMGGRTMTKVPVSPSETTASIDSGTLGEGIYLCTLVANGQNIGTKRLVKTR